MVLVDGVGSQALAPQHGGIIALNTAGVHFPDGYPAQSRDNMIAHHTPVAVIGGVLPVWQIDLLPG